MNSRIGKAAGSESVNHADRLAELRSRIATLKASIESTESAFASRDVAVQRINTYVDVLAAAAAESSPARAFMYPDDRRVALLSDYRLDRQVEQLLAWLDPKALRDRLVAYVDETYATLDPTAVMSPEAREATRAQAVKDLFAAEVEEERLIVAAESAGIAINRRGDANPAAILAA